MRTSQTPIMSMLLVAAWCFLPCAGSRALSQVESLGGTIPDQRTPMQVDLLTFAGPDSAHSRLDVFIQVSYDNLSFSKRDEDVYDASYELTLTVQDSGGALVTEKVWTEEIRGITFKESVAAGASRMSQRSISLVPGTYTVAVSLRDIDSKETRRLARNVVVRPYTLKQLALSDIMLISRVTTVGDKHSIVPSVSANVGLVQDAFSIYFETYTPRVDTLRFAAAVLDRGGNVLLATDTVRTVRPGWKNETLMRVEHGSLGVGDYLLRVAVLPPSANPADDGMFSAVVLKRISVRWRGLPQGPANLDLAIEQLRYIAKDNEMSVLKDAKTMEEKQQRFLDFWKKRDPNPNTPRNERMEQYYARVDYANKHFSHYTDGWRTDMGMVYIMFGSPNNVDRHPFDIDSKPYEIWSYYELNQQFVFVDETGFGDYRLATPLWEVWQRSRD